MCLTEGHSGIVHERARVRVRVRVRPCVCLRMNAFVDASLCTWACACVHACMRAHLFASVYAPRQLASLCAKAVLPQKQESACEGVAAFSLALLHFLTFARLFFVHLPDPL
eukprot:3327461-Pleurochrysis_carterae.AAC.3